MSQEISYKAKFYHLDSFTTHHNKDENGDKIILEDSLSTLIARKPSTTICHINDGDRTVAIGMSICSRQDSFDNMNGRNRSLARALHAMILKRTESFILRDEAINTGICVSNFYRLDQYEFGKTQIADLQAQSMKTKRRLYYEKIMPPSVILDLEGSFKQRTYPKSSYLETAEVSYPFMIYDKFGHAMDVASYLCSRCKYEQLSLREVMLEHALIGNCKRCGKEEWIHLEGLIV